jgi:hypothetical protein
MTGELSVGITRDEQLATVSVEFIFADHSESNLGKVADAVLASDGDIIAIEKIREGSFGMGTSEEKVELAERMTRFIAAGSTTAQTASEYFHTDEPFFTKLLDSLKCSGKRIVLLDMGTDDEGYVHYQKGQLARHAYNESVEASASNEDLFFDYEIATAQSDEYREKVMGDQITSLAEANPSLKITVMAGAMHTPLSHNISSAIKSNRKFVPTDEAIATYAPNEKMHFDRPWSDMRLIRFNLKKFGLSTLPEVEDQPLRSLEQLR